MESKCSGKTTPEVGLYWKRSSNYLENADQETDDNYHHNQSESSISHIPTRRIMTNHPKRLQLSRRTFYPGNKCTTDRSLASCSSSITFEKSKEHQQEAFAESSRTQEKKNLSISSTADRGTLGFESSLTAGGLDTVPRESESSRPRFLREISSGAGAPCSSTIHVDPKHETQIERLSSSLQESNSTGSSIHDDSRLGPICNTGYDLRNMKCKSVQNVIPSYYSSSDTTNCRLYSSRERLPDCESSSSRNKDVIECFDREKSSHFRKTSPCRPSSHTEPQQVSRSTNLSSSRDGAISVRRWRPSNGEGSMRLSRPGNNSQPFWISGLSQEQAALDETTSSITTSPFHAEVTRRRQGCHNNTISTRQVAHLQDRGVHSSFRSLVDRGGNQYINMNRISEELFLSEANTFLGRFRVQDQYSEMRLDIDNMSYEELLALEEKMGTVTTALTEEELSEHLKKHLYMPARDRLWFASSHDDDTVKCTICQEKYCAGDEVGKLHCQHTYHMACISQWLRMKNWCPICKVSAVP